MKTLETFQTFSTHMARIVGHFSLQGNITDIGFLSELHNIVCENNGMQVSIA